MSCAGWALVLNLVGGLLLALPSLHAGYRGIKAYRFEPKPADRGLIRAILEAASGTIERSKRSLRRPHFFVSLAGLAVLLAGFGVDFLVCG